MTLDFRVNGQSIARTDNNTTAAGSVAFVRARFAASSDWLGGEYTLKGVFTAVGSSYHVLLDGDGCCTVPCEVLTAEGFFTVGLIGVGLGENSSLLRATSNTVSVRVEAGPATEGSDSAASTPAEIEQIEGELALMGTKLTALAETDGISALCRTNDLWYWFVWIGGSGSFSAGGTSVTLDDGAVYKIKKSGGGDYELTRVFSALGTKGDKGDPGDTGPRGYRGLSFTPIASATELSAWQANTDSSGESGLALVTSEFSLMYNGAQRTYVAGSVLRRTSGSETVVFNVRSYVNNSCVVPTTTLTSASLTLSYQPPTGKNYDRYTALVYIPADSQTRHVEAKLGTASIGKITSLSCQQAQILRITCENQGVWITDFVGWQASYQSLDAFRSANIGTSLSQSRWSFFGKNELSGATAGVFSIAASVAFPVGTQYEIYGREVG